MFSHVHIGITDFERAFAFYSGVMDELGFTLKFSEPEKPWAGWMQPGRDRRSRAPHHPNNGHRREYVGFHFVAYPPGSFCSVPPWK